MPSTGAGPTASRSRVSHSAVTPIDSRGSKSVSIAAAIGVAGRGADDAPAALEQQLRVLDQTRPHRRAGGREARHVVAVLAAQELVDGHAERLARDVVQRDVDRRDRAGQHPPTLEVLAAIHLLPQRAAPHRVLPDQELAVVADRADNRHLAP